MSNTNNKTMGVSPITDTIFYGTVKDDKWVGKMQDVCEEQGGGCIETMLAIFKGIVRKGGVE